MKNVIEIYEGYLDQVIDLPDGLQLEEKILACWKRRKDVEAFVDRGNFFTEQSTLSSQNNSQSALLTAISSYKEALRFYRAEQAPLQYAVTQNNLGIAYRNLAGYQEPIENLQQAIDAYTEALHVRTAERTPLDYAVTQNNFGNAYNNLASYQEPIENLQRAIDAYTEALRFYRAQGTSLQYAVTQNSLALVYARLGARLRYENRLQDAISLFENSHRLFPRIVTALQLGGIYKQLRNTNLSQKYIEEGRRLVDKDDLYNLACLESLAGNTNLAFEYLKAADERKEFDRAWVWQDSDLQLLQRDSRFEQIVGSKPK